MQTGFSYKIIRWPFVLIIGFVIFVELWMYIWIRSFVKAYEYTFTWRKKLRQHRDKLVNAYTFEEWQGAALKLEKYQGYEAWKATNNEIPPLYDHPLISNIVSQLKTYRDTADSGNKKQNQLSKLGVMLEVACKSNLGGIENEHLYSHTYTGTKKLVEEFYNETADCLKYMYISDFPIKEKKALFKKLCKDYGKTALCLSGGATFGFYHLGVIKTLHERGCLPNIIAGTSMGSLIAALICVRNDQELIEDEIFSPSLHSKLKSSDDPFYANVIRFLTKGAFYDIDQWVKNISWITKGNTTFKEAFIKTGRILNISAVPTERHSPPKLLNYLNAPNVVIWSAVIASAAIPGLIDAVELKYKDEETGEIKPWTTIGSKWRDGSLKTDIPTATLHALFNVNYTIVSQVNPHIVPFFFNNRGSGGAPVSHRKGKGWRGGFILSSFEHFLKLDMMKWLRLLRDLDLLPAVLGQDWSYVFLQRFYGSVTFTPRVILKDYFLLISDPTEKELRRYLIGGERSVWPKMTMVENRMKIEKLLYRFRSQLTDEIFRESAVGEGQSTVHTL